MSARPRWQEMAMVRKDKRAENRERGTSAMRAAGVAFEVLDNGWHLRVEHNGEVIDFTPGSDSWSVKGKCGLHRGMQTLIRYLATGELPSTRKT